MSPEKRIEAHIRLEQSMQEEVAVIQECLVNILHLLGERIDTARSGEGYYWDNCREIVVRIKNEVNKLPDWVKP